MVDQNQGATPYELFQEVKSIGEEMLLLKARMGVLRELRTDVGEKLCSKCYPGNEIDDCGIVIIDGFHYHYELDIEDDCIREFQLLPVVTNPATSNPSVQPST